MSTLGLPDFVVGSTVHVGAGDPAPDKVRLTYRWRQSDPSGICSQTGTVTYISNEDSDEIQVLAWSTVRRSVTFDVPRIVQFSISFDTADCAGNSRHTGGVGGLDLLPITYNSGSTYEDGATHPYWSTARCGCFLGGPVQKGYQGAIAYVEAPPGSKLAVATNTGAGRGSASVSVDGTVLGPINDAVPAGQARNGVIALATPTVPAGGPHTLRIEVGDGRFDLDGVYVLQ